MLVAARAMLRTESRVVCAKVSLSLASAAAAFGWRAACLALAMNETHKHTLACGVRSYFPGSSTTKSGNFRILSHPLPDISPMNRLDLLRILRSSQKMQFH